MKRRLFLSGMLGAAAAAPALSHAGVLPLLDARGSDGTELMKYRLDIIIEGLHEFKYVTRRVMAHTSEGGTTNFEIMDDMGPLFEFESEGHTEVVGAHMNMPKRFQDAGFHEWTLMTASSRLPMYLIPGDVFIVNKT